MVEAINANTIKILKAELKRDKNNELYSKGIILFGMKGSVVTASFESMHGTPDSVYSVIIDNDDTNENIVGTKENQEFEYAIDRKLTEWYQGGMAFPYAIQSEPVDNGTDVIVKGTCLFKSPYEDEPRDLVFCIHNNKCQTVSVREVDERGNDLGVPVWVEAAMFDSHRNLDDMGMPPAFAAHLSFEGLCYKRFENIHYENINVGSIRFEKMHLLKDENGEMYSRGTITFGYTALISEVEVAATIESIHGSPDSIMSMTAGGHDILNLDTDGDLHETLNDMLQEWYENDVLGDAK